MPSAEADSLVPVSPSVTDVAGFFLPPLTRLLHALSRSTQCEVEFRRQLRSSFVTVAEVLGYSGVVPLVLSAELNCATSGFDSPSR